MNSRGEKISQEACDALGAQLGAIFNMDIAPASQNEKDVIQDKLLNMPLQKFVDKLACLTYRGQSQTPRLKAIVQTASSAFHFDLSVNAIHRRIAEAVRDMFSTGVGSRLPRSPFKEMFPLSLENWEVRTILCSRLGSAVGNAPVPAAKRPAPPSDAASKPPRPEKQQKRLDSTSADEPSFPFDIEPFYIHDAKLYFKNLTEDSRERVCDAAGLLCPVTLAPFEDPITLPACGHTMDRKSVLDMKQAEPTCPVCKVPVGVPADTIPTSYTVSQAVELVTGVPRKDPPVRSAESQRQARLKRVFSTILSSVGRDVDALVDRALCEVEKAATERRATAFLSVPKSTSTRVLQAWIDRLVRYGFKAFASNGGVQADFEGYRIELPAYDQAAEMLEKSGRAYE